MSEQIIINAVSRSELGSNRARNIRSENMVPAVIYGNDKDLLNVNIPLNELVKASQNDLFFTQILIIKVNENDEKVVLKELQREPMKGKLLHADFMRVSSKTMLKVTIPFSFLNEEDCIGVKTEGGIVTKTMRDIEILCSAENIPEIIEVDVAALNLGDSIRLTDLSLPKGSEIPGLSEETDQMIVSVNAPKAVVEEEPLGDDALEGEDDGGEVTEETSDEGSADTEEKEEASE
tara:strand:- start:1682 stop:2383 length:702 start_codon:yes stop_codon:yes gene_type:complete